MATTGIGDTASSYGVGTTGSQVSGIGQTIRDTTHQKLTDQKARASETLGIVAGAVRAMTEPLREGGQSSVADYVNKAAENIDRWAEQLRQRNIDDTVRAAQDFARREPALFLGLAFGAGALLARFLKSSTTDGHRSYTSASGGGRGRAENSGRENPTSGGYFDDRRPRVNEPTVGGVASGMPSGREVL